jgi:hypothetical protein
MSITIIVARQTLMEEIMSEDFDHGPNGIIAYPGWRYVRHCPPDAFLKLSFSFDALWSNMIWVCNANTREVLVSRFASNQNEDFVTDIHSLSDIGLVAYHKLVSDGVDHPERFPFRQSPMAILYNDGRVITVGFNDEGGPGFRQAVCTIAEVH